MPTNEFPLTQDVTAKLFSVAPGDSYAEVVFVAADRVQLLEASFVPGQELPESVDYARTLTLTNETQVRDLATLEIAPEDVTAYTALDLELAEDEADLACEVGDVVRLVSENADSGALHPGGVLRLRFGRL